ncbi:MAG: excinuclease ABC subunit UvrC [Betaproteobacteria bacterium]|nr:MAG: excinuclease ABC subunit UvrC [Betaproteobacteria bacterium]
MTTHADPVPAFDPQALSSSLPHLPGVYRMLNARSDVLYVGKARDLKKRVSSYFQKTAQSPRIALMLTQVAAVQTTVTRSEAEALILENNLIKSLAPRYNILFRDDKSYPFLMLSGHTFARLGFHRGAIDDRHRYFGPFPHTGAVRESIQLLQKIFRLRTCEDSVFQNRSRPCLLHQIRRCSAPCVGLIDSDSYAVDAKNAELFLLGRENDVLQALGNKMQQAAEQQRYEQAAFYRDQIQALSTTQQKQYAESSTGGEADVIACAGASGAACVNLVMMRRGRHLGDKSFFPQNAEGRTETEVLQAFLAQHYVNRQVPTVIVVGAEFDVQEIETTLSDQAGHPVQLVTRPQAQRRAWLEMAQKNAQLALAQRISHASNQEVRLAALRDGLGLPHTVQRIECFDISHTQGEATVASCVVYDRLELRNSEYRRYNIAGIQAGDDYAAMRSVLQRRYEKISRGEGVMPDLVLIDGGKGQVNVAREVLAELGVNDTFLFGVAKGEDRRPGLEQLICADARSSIQLERDNPGLHLIQAIRDEAHRFAITGHRARRGKARVTSSLEGISGVGAKRRKALLTRFGGLKGVIGASIDDLAQVQGISRKLAEKIYLELH